VFFGNPVKSPCAAHALQIKPRRKNQMAKLRFELGGKNHYTLSYAECY
jgi:hypothetical protein